MKIKHLTILTLCLLARASLLKSMHPQPGRMTYPTTTAEAALHEQLIAEAKTHAAAEQIAASADAKQITETFHHAGTLAEAELPRVLNNIVKSYINFDGWDYAEAFKIYILTLTDQMNGGHIDNGHIDNIIELSDNRIVSSTYAGVIKIWDLATKKCLATLQGNKAIDSIIDLKGNYIASCSHSTMKVWDLTSNTCVAELQEKGDICSIMPLDQHRTIFRCCEAIKIWNWHDNSLIVMFTVPKEAEQLIKKEYGINDISFWPHLPRIGVMHRLSDGKIAAALLDGTIRIWDINSQQCIALLSGHKHAVHSFVQLDQRHLATMTKRGSVRVWDLNTQQCIIKIKIPREPIPDMMIELGYWQAVCILRDGTLRILDFKTKSYSTLEGLKQYSRVIKLSEHRIVSSSLDGTIKIWDLNTKKCVCNLVNQKTAISAFRKLSNGNLIFGSLDGSIKILKIYETQLDIVQAGLRAIEPERLDLTMQSAQTDKSSKCVVQ